MKLDDSVQLADVARARANLTLSKTKHERSEDLRTRLPLGAGARRDAQQPQGRAGRCRLMEARISKTAIRRPFSGTIGLRQVSVGDYVKEGQDMVTLESIDPLKVDFRVPELALSQVKDGQTIQITLDAIPDKPTTAGVRDHPLIDANGRAIVIRAQVPNKTASCSGHVRAREALHQRLEGHALVVPWVALPARRRQVVYKVVEGKATRQKIRDRAAPRGPRRGHGRPRPR